MNGRMKTAPIRLTIMPASTCSREATPKVTNTTNAFLKTLSLAAPANWVQKNGAKRRSRSSANWLWRIIEEVPARGTAASPELDRHGRGQRGVMAIVFEREIVRHDALQPFGLVMARLRELGYPIVDGETRQRERLATQLLVQHVELVFVDVRVADEVRQVARGISGEAPDERQQHRRLAQVERRAESEVVRPYVQA